MKISDTSYFFQVFLPQFPQIKCTGFVLAVLALNKHWLSRIEMQCCLGVRSEVPQAPSSFCCSICAKRTFLVVGELSFVQMWFQHKISCLQLKLFLFCPKDTEMCSETSCAQRYLSQSHLCGRNFCKYTSGNDAHNSHVEVIILSGVRVSDPIDL